MLRAMISLQEVVRLRNAAASHWMHRGMALAEKNSPGNLTEAVLCFDEAIALRSLLPLAEIPWFRYALSASWINRADTFARLDLNEERVFAEAIHSYDEALHLLSSLSLDDNALYVRRLAIGWIQRGAAIQNRGRTSRIGEALACFESAIRVLEHPMAAALADQRAMQAGAWANWAAASLLRTDPDTDRICQAARTVLALTASHEDADPAAAQTGFSARLTLCRLLVRRLASGSAIPEELLANATDAADGGLALARRWEAAGQARWRATARELFRLGCQIYQECQPRFVAEFILECLDPEMSIPAVPPDAAVGRIATASLWSVAERIQQRSFTASPGHGVFDVLAEVRTLRAAEDRVRTIVRHWSGET